MTTSLMQQQQNANIAKCAKCAHPLQLRYGEVSSERNNRRREGREPRAASAVAEGDPPTAEGGRPVAAGDPPTGRRRRPTDRRRPIFDIMHSPLRLQ